MNKYYGVVHAIRYLSQNTVFGPDTEGEGLDKRPKYNNKA